MQLGGELAATGWRQHAVAAAADLAGALLLRRAAGQLGLGGKRASSTATAYLCCAAALLLAGGTGPAASAQNLALLGALATALTPGGGALSASLLAVGGADWPLGSLLLGVPLAMFTAQRPADTAQRAAGDERCGETAAPALKPLAAYACCWVAGAAALRQLQHALAPAMAARLDRWVGLTGWEAAVRHSGPGSRGGHDALAWVGSRAAAQPAHQAHALLLPAASLQPGLGLHWYLLAQTFPQFRAFFLYVLAALPAALMLPLGLRFPCRPALLLAAGALLRCLLHPRPVPAMAVLCLCVLPLAQQHVWRLGGLAWHALATAAALLLSDAALQLWLGERGGNANFLYGMNLLWGGLLVLLTLRLLRGAARAEAGGGAAGGEGGAAGGGRG